MAWICERGGNLVNVRTWGLWQPRTCSDSGKDRLPLQNVFRGTLGNDGLLNKD